MFSYSVLLFCLRHIFRCDAGKTNPRRNYLIYFSTLSQNNIDKHHCVADISNVSPASPEYGAASRVNALPKRRPVRANPRGRART